MLNPSTYRLILFFALFAFQTFDVLAITNGQQVKTKLHLSSKTELQRGLATNGQRVQTKVYRSPKIELQPGMVSRKVYTNMPFPKGHIAIKSFNAELVDKNGHPVPLHDVYLHHWIVIRYHQEIKNLSNIVFVDNTGLCNANGGLRQYFGLGSETRRTATDIPDPYGIVVGNPAEVPQGFQEEWLLNVHAIDTRRAVDKQGCNECTCNVYSNFTLREPLPENYIGGLRCCPDGAQCKVKDGSSRDVKKTIYLKYTVKYVDWDALIVPLRIYILDVTDSGTNHSCQVEHDVPACPRGKHDGTCIHTRAVKFNFDKGGDVIYGVGHLHTGGTAIALYGQGGNEICSSHGIYGTGKKAGNEAGYLVGMSTCYPRPGSVKIYPGETVTLVSNYSNVKRHTGVMSLIYLLVADSSV